MLIEYEGILKIVRLYYRNASRRVGCEVTFHSTSVIASKLLSKSQDCFSGDGLSNQESFTVCDACEVAVELFTL